MKLFYFAGAGLFSVLILIFGFQNFNASVQGFTIFFYAFNSINGSIVVFGSAFLGIIAGAFYFAALGSFMNKDDDDEIEE